MHMSQTTPKNGTGHGYGNRGHLHHLSLCTSLIVGQRFSLEPNRIIPAGMSRTSRSFNSSLRNALAHMDERSLVIRKAGTSQTGTGAGGGPISPSSTLHLYSSPHLAGETSKRSTLGESEAASLEARRLASFPAGQPPEDASVPPIERYDWPAPASTAVMTAEMSE